MVLNTKYFLIKSSVYECLRPIYVNFSWDGLHYVPYGFKNRKKIIVLYTYSTVKPAKAQTRTARPCASLRVLGSHFYIDSVKTFVFGFQPFQP